MRTNTLSKKVGQLIKKMRIEAGYTSASLGQEVGLTKASISNIENGKQRIYIDTVWAIAQTIGCPMSDLLPPNPQNLSNIEGGDLASRKGLEWAKMANIDTFSAMTEATKNI